MSHFTGIFLFFSQIVGASSWRVCYQRGLPRLVYLGHNLEFQCTVEQKDFFAQLTAAVKIDLGLEIQSLPKCPFLTVFSKIYRPTKVNMLGNWEVSILFRNLWRFFSVF